MVGLVVYDNLERNFIMDAKISEKALSLVLRAKAFHAQYDVCWHGFSTYGYGCGIRGFDSQYGEPVECVGCELGGDEPPYEPAEIYYWALATARGIRWEPEQPVFDSEEGDIYA
jgi:hypothetical protein